MKTSEEIENLAKDLFIRETGSTLNHNNDYIIDLMVKTYKLAKSEKHTLKELCNQDNDLKN